MTDNSTPPVVIHGVHHLKSPHDWRAVPDIISDHSAALEGHSSVTVYTVNLPEPHTLRITTHRGKRDLILRIERTPGLAYTHGGEVVK